MANTKISALTASTTPLAGTEVLPIVQSGATTQVSVANLTAGRAVSAASLALTTTPLPATSGGTGQSSYAVGDLLYASTTTALSKLADVATGNALISGGVSTAPSWGKIGLTTHVSGTLPVANGGTNLTSYTANGVVYASSSSVLTTSSSFTFDGTNFSISTSGNPVSLLKTSGAGNNPVYRLQADTAYWDIQGTFSNAGDELYFQYNGAARSYINSSTGAYVPVSDRNLKKNIVDISHGLSAIMALRPVEYNMKTESDDAEKHLGFIAQEAREVIPSSVSEMLNDLLGMDKTEVIAVLVKAVQELKIEFDEYKSTHP